jgi:cytochrome c peroxidase
MKSLTIVVFALLFVASCSSNTEQPKSQPAAAPAPPPAPKPDVGPLGEMAIPADNPITADKVELGKKLFFDTRLSKTGKMACESCHLPDKGWADGKALSPKFDGSMNTRHTPTLINAG